VTEETNGYEEKLSMSDIGQQHGITSGISRQQLINRYFLFLCRMNKILTFHSNINIGKSFLINKIMHFPQQTLLYKLISSCQKNNNCKLISLKTGFNCVKTMSNLH